MGSGSKQFSAEIKCPQYCKKHIKQHLSALPDSKPTAIMFYHKIHFSDLRLTKTSKLLKRWLYLTHNPGNPNYGTWSQSPGVSPFLLWFNLRAPVKGQSYPFPVPPVPKPCVPTAAPVLAQMTTEWGSAAYRSDCKHTSSVPSTKKAVLCWISKLNQFRQLPGAHL